MANTEPLHDREPKQAQIVRLVRMAVEAGQLRDGEVLPNTRDLAAQYGVSPFTVNEAMQTLAGLGYVENRDRAGRVVRDPGQGHRRMVPERNATPTILFVGGYAGSGKTEFGRILARLTGWPILDKDTTTRPVVELALEVLGLDGSDRESPKYLERVRPREYEALIATASENAACGVSAIITAPFIREFTDPAWLDRTTALFRDHGARTVWVWIRCDPDTMHTYVRSRGAARDAGKLADWDGYVSNTVNPDFEPARPHVLVDNSADARPLQAQAAVLLRQLERAEQVQ